MGRVTIYLNQVEEEKLKTICTEHKIENISTCIKFLILNELKKAPAMDPVQLKLVQILDLLAEIKLKLERLDNGTE